MSMHLLKVALLATCAARLLRSEPKVKKTAAPFALTPPRVLSDTGKAAFSDSVFAGLAAAVRKGDGACETYVEDTLKAIAFAYTNVQVPTVLHSVCRQGTFFHAFEDKEQCTKVTDELLVAWDKGGPYDGWCKDVAQQLGGSEGNDICECIAIPDSVARNGSQVKATSGNMYPETYGGECKAHDLETDACAGEYKPSWCYEKWCYVDPACEAKDKKGSFFFGKEAELLYSYNTCGGTDAFAAEACAAQSETDCEGFSSNCAWNKPSGSCQNKLCQCTGSNNKLDVKKHGFLEGYGESCTAWDSQSCAEYEEMGDGYSLGLWCCKDWCYVDEGCPSAEASAVGASLFYSYFACPDRAEELQQCPWKEPIDFGGEPIALSSDAAAALNKATE